MCKSPWYARSVLRRTSPADPCPPRFEEWKSLVWVFSLHCHHLPHHLVSSFPLGWWTSPAVSSQTPKITPSVNWLSRMNCYDYDKTVSKPLPHSDGGSAGDAGARWCFHWCRAAPSDSYCTWLFHWEAFQKTPTQDSHFWLVSPSRESIIDWCESNRHTFAFTFFSNNAKHHARIGPFFCRSRMKVKVVWCLTTKNEILCEHEKWVSCLISSGIKSLNESTQLIQFICILSSEASSKIYCWKSRFSRQDRDFFFSYLVFWDEIEIFAFLISFFETRSRFLLS